jgi:hypothetical protein
LPAIYVYPKILPPAAAPSPAFVDGRYKALTIDGVTIAITVAVASINPHPNGRYGHGRDKYMGSRDKYTGSDKGDPGGRNETVPKPITTLSIGSNSGAGEQYSSENGHQSSFRFHNLVF